MTTLTLKNSKIFIGNGVLDNVGTSLRSLSRGTRAALISDSNVAPLYADRICEMLRNSGFCPDVFTIPAGEASKTLQTVSDIYAFLAKHGFTRSDPLIALGGGVIGDITGFTAATYLRGVPSMQIPTSLLAQVDSSVGGKCGVDLPQGKNLVGVINQPDIVLIDPTVLKTLPESIFADGMAEVIKYGCIMDEKLFYDLESTNIHDILSEVIISCVTHKRNIVDEDEYDNGIRMILNFGHTVGHAVEALGGFSQHTHGYAVAIGMVAASKIGEALGVTEINTAARIAHLLHQYQLPTDLPYPLHQLIPLITMDKKMRDQKLHMILLNRIGQAKIHALQPSQIKELK